MLIDDLFIMAAFVFLPFNPCIKPNDVCDIFQFYTTHPALRPNSIVDRCSSGQNNYSGLGLGQQPQGFHPKGWLRQDNNYMYSVSTNFNLMTFIMYIVNVIVTSILFTERMSNRTQDNLFNLL